MIVFISLLSGVIYIFLTDYKIDEVSFYDEVEKPVLLDRGVEVRDADGRVISTDLPVNLKGKSSYSIKFIPEISEDEQTVYICINSSYLSYTVTCEGEIINEYTKAKNTKFESMGSSVHTFPIPKKHMGKEIEIVYTSNIDTIYGMKIFPIIVGSRSSIIKQLFVENSTIVILFLLFFIISIILFAMYLVSVFMKIENKKNLIISVFILNFSIAGIFSSWVTYYYIENNLFCYFVESNFINICYIPLFLIVHESFKRDKLFCWRYKSLNVMIVVLMLNAVIQLIVSIVFSTDYIIMRPVSQILYVLFFMFLIVIIMTTDSSKLKDKKVLIISLGPLSFRIIYSSLEYIFTYQVSYIEFLIMDVVFFLLVQILMEVSSYVKKNILAIEGKFYKELAYVDSMSGLLNRHAFDRDMRALKNGEKFYKNILFVMLDMNGLKTINDKYGHTVGDSYIKASGELLMNICHRYVKTYAYRYAGDEFFLLSYDNDNETVRKIISKIDMLQAEFKSEECKLPLSLAIGYEYRPIDKNFSLGDVMKRVDEKMYMDKRRKKEDIYA